MHTVETETQMYGGRLAVNVLSTALGLVRKTTMKTTTPATTRTARTRTMLVRDSKTKRGGRGKTQRGWGRVEGVARG